MSQARASGLPACLKMGCGCLWWIAGLTAIAWWLGGRAWGVLTLAATIAVTIVAMVMSWLHEQTTRAVDEARDHSRGTMSCHRCSGSGWVRHDMYNERTCPLCNGSGWEDDPRQGPTLFRSVE